MSDFPRHTLESAPDSARPFLEEAEKAFGFVPNLIRYRLFAESGFTEVQRQVVLLSVAVENRCDYCVAAHTAGATMADAPEDVVGALRNEEELPDPGLQALSRFTRAVVRERGWVSDKELRRFLDAGFERRHVLEVILGVTQKTLSNYTNHIVNTELDQALEDFAWTPPSEREEVAAD